MLELYRKEHNNSVHRFSEAGQTQRWSPSQKLKAYLADQQTMEFDPDHIDDFIRYGFDKRKASRVGRALPSPSSNRTCGFPASGFPVDFTKGHTQESAYEAITNISAPSS
jgi:hypothetical protein